LRRWTAWHDEWEDEVASLAVDTRDGLVLIDPIDPPPDVRSPDHVLVTVYWHGRSTHGADAKRVWAPGRSEQPLRNRGIDVTDVFRAGDELPGGIRAFQTARAAEVAYVLPDHGALAVGDVLLGAGAKPLGKATHDDLRASLRPVLDFPLERVLVSHGKPVLRDGHAALAAVL
jgi:glyoxylase-like metal-dependent hydrolase (beta-lactamase superfamily II)